MPVDIRPPRRIRCCPFPASRSARPPRSIKNWERNDVLLVVCEPGTVAAGVFTQNRFCAAPVVVCREHLARQHARHAEFRALVVNAGNANAGTGASGLADAQAECVAVARLLDCAPEDVLPYSTGVIMEPLPVAKIVAALPAAKAAARADGWFAAANAIMTTDTVPKGASRRVIVDGVPVTVTGIAKGAGMIHPNMATMLSFIATDAPIARAAARAHRPRGRRRVVQRRDGRRRHVDQRQLRARGDGAREARPDRRRRRRAARADPPRDRGVRGRARAGDRARRRGRHQVHRDPRRGRARRSTSAGASRSASRTPRS